MSIRFSTALFLVSLALWPHAAFAANATIQQGVVSATVPYIEAGKSSDNVAASALAFRTNGTEMMRVTATGSVGIGTTGPAERLDLGSGNIAMGYERKLCSFTADQSGWLSCVCSSGKRVLGASCRGTTSGTPFGYDLADVNNGSSDTGAACFKTSTAESAAMNMTCANIR